MKKRIFIVIDLADEVKRELLSYEKRWRNLSVKWTNFYKMRITFEFLGQVDRKGLESIAIACQNTASSLKPFNIRLDKIILGPDSAQAKMIWATIHIDSGILQLQKTIHKELIEQDFDLEEFPFNPHIVLARARGNQLKGKKTNVVLKNLRFKASGIEIMESQLRPNIEKYKFIESFEFKE